MSRQHMRRIVLCFVLAASAAAFAPLGAQLRSGSPSWQGCRIRPPSGVRRWRWRMDSDTPPARVGKKTEGMRRSAEERLQAAENKVVVLGLSHKTASVDIREKLAVPEDKWQDVQRSIAQLSSVKEAALISTCNRHEIYFVTPDANRGIFEVTRYLSEANGVSKAELRKSLFMLTEEEAVWHVLRVASGLDSLVIGEGQILSQMKKCYELASSKEGSAGKVLTRMLNTAVSAGKRVRTETSISRGGVSISSAAVELVDSKCLSVLSLEMDQLDICIVGAGKMARLLVQHLMPRSPKSITIINRSRARVQELQQQFPASNIIAADMDQMLPIVGRSHCTFACTGAMQPILHKGNLEGAMERAAMLVDISVPRNIDDQGAGVCQLLTFGSGGIAQGANQIEGVTAYNVDDLKAVVAANQARRQRLVLEAEELLQEELKTFGSWHQSLGTVPMISRFQGHADSIRLQELQRWESKLSGLTPQERETVRKMTKRIVAKLLHGPISHLRTMDNVDDFEGTVKSFEQMFKLKGGGEAEKDDGDHRL